MNPSFEPLVLVLTEEEVLQILHILSVLLWVRTVYFDLQILGPDRQTCQHSSNTRSYHMYTFIFTSELAAHATVYKKISIFLDLIESD